MFFPARDTVGIIISKIKHNHYEHSRGLKRLRYFYLRRTYEMKQGRALPEVLMELQRQNAAKQD